MIGAGTRQELQNLLAADTRKIIITTIHKFSEAEGCLNERGNIIVMVDEAHRTQEGNLGRKMRAALPNAFLFDLTGTPINKRDRNTFWAFGAEEDEQGYMSHNSFQDSIRDKATLPLHFETVDVRLPRVESICKHTVKLFQEKVEPNGFKAQVVTFARECCVLYKKVMDMLISPDVCAIAMHTQGGKADAFAAWRLDKEVEEKLIDCFQAPKDPLKFLIVTSKLLTGFDAPILQAIYLDKPMKEHNLFQAICRTNRVYPGKTHGLIVDCLGIFDDVTSALDFDEKNVHNVIINLEELKKQLPAVMTQCLAFFPGVDRRVSAVTEGCLRRRTACRTMNAGMPLRRRTVLFGLWEALCRIPALRRTPEIISG